MSSLTFDDPRRFVPRCLAFAAALLCKYAAAQAPSGPTPPPASPSGNATAEFPAYDPNAPPPPPPPPPYATQQPTPSQPPPAYGPLPLGGVNPPGPGVAPAPVSPPPAYPTPVPAAPPAGYSEPPPTYAAPNPAAAADSSAPTYAAEPVEAAVPPSSGFTVPDFAVRVDPLNWLLEGQFGVELEVEALEWLTVEAIPMFVVSPEPLALPEGIRLHSNGLGALAGASLSAGFWLEGNSFQGTVVRAGLSNYGYRYTATGKSGEAQEGQIIDEAAVRQTRVSLVLGSGRRFGYFMMSGGFGIEYELNDQRRCVKRVNSMYKPGTEDCPREEFVLMRRYSEPDAANLRGPLFPVEFVLRFSIGVVFDD